MTKLQLPWRFTLLSILFATLSLSCSSDPDSEPDPIPTPGSASNSSAGFAPYFYYDKTGKSTADVLC
ncbi:MAG: hypothetical protein IJY30_01890 [Muribaculaceae bacterium]|nr:hypothetical protein [Muribaculaceae bacterium]MBQ9073207.1 hypothetical protein [Muribaculaceae bacterium]